MSDINQYTGALNAPSHRRELVLRLLQDVCKSYGVAGWCIYTVFKRRIGEVLP